MFMKFNKSYLSFFLVASSALAAQSIIPEQTVQMGGFNFKVEGYEGVYVPLADERVNIGAIRNGNSDDGSYGGIPIGFSFSYLGKTYTDITPSTNGWFAFGDQSIEKESYGLTNDLANGGIRALVAPLWDDMVMPSAYGAEFRYFTEGSKDAQIFTAEWKKVVWTSSAEDPVISFQVKLYEAESRIEFIYSDEANAYNSSKGGASIGITSEGKGEGSFISITPKLDEFNTKIASDNITVKPKTNQVFSFIQTDRTPVEMISFTLNGNLLGWTTASETNNSGWEIQNRQIPLNPPLVKGETNGVKGEFQKIGFVPGKGTTTEKQNYIFPVSGHRSSASKVEFRLKQIDYDGNFSFSQILALEPQPQKFHLTDNYPNPFNPSTIINYELGSRSFTTLKIYDLLGREIKTLVSKYEDEGLYSVKFDATDLPSGIYFCRLQAGHFSEIRKMMLVK